MPAPRSALHGATEDAQHRGRHRVPKLTAVLTGADIQEIVGTVLDAPVLASQLQEAGRIGLGRGQDGDDPDRLDFLPFVLEFPNPVKAGRLRHVRKAHLSRSHFPDLDAAPFDAPVARIHGLGLGLRGNNLPKGSGELGVSLSSEMEANGR